jgi:hypothetical protein
VGAFAQQPAEWRPNFAEDNKAATEADTITFVTQMLTKSDSLRTLSTHSNAACKLAVSNVASIEMQRPMRHMLELPNQPSVRLAVFDGRDARVLRVAATRPWTIRLASREIDFSRIDPLEITVKPAQQTWAIRVSGTSGQTIGNEVASSYEGKSPNDQDDPASVLQMIRDLGLAVPCLTRPPKGFSCTPSEASVTDTEFLVSDLDAAKRIARAMMHEALVCGGKKAVSPF